MKLKIDNMLLQTTRLLASDKPLFSKQRRVQLALVAQAIYGLLWVEGASWKIIVDGKIAFNHDGLAYWASRGSEFPVLGIYKSLLDHVILPNIVFLTPIVFALELTIGVLFLAGKYVRIAAGLAFVQTIAISLSVLNTPHEWKWSYFLMMLVAAIFFVTPTISQWPNKLFRRG